jgi:Cadherin domain
LCRSVVHVVLTDVNDNPPRFTWRGTYTATIPEDAAVGTPVIRVAATDPDLGINRRVRYGLEAGEGDPVRTMFKIDPISGVLTLQQTVDREERSNYLLTVSASDQVCDEFTLHCPNVTNVSSLLKS